MKKWMIWCIMAVLLLSLTACHNQTLPKECPDDFAIYFKWGIGENIFDTYNNKLTKDLISNGSAETTLTVDRETLELIYSELLQNKIAYLGRYMDSQNLRGPLEGGFDQSPCATYQIRFHINGKEFSVAGNETAFAYRKKNRQAANFCNFVEFMEDLAMSTPEYKSLPESSGGYM